MPVENSYAGRIQRWTKICRTPGIPAISRDSRTDACQLFYFCADRRSRSWIIQPSWRLMFRLRDMDEVPRPRNPTQGKPS